MFRTSPWLNAIPRVFDLPDRFYHPFEIASGNLSGHQVVWDSTSSTQPGGSSIYQLRKVTQQQSPRGYARSTYGLNFLEHDGDIRFPQRQNAYALSERLATSLLEPCAIGSGPLRIPPFPDKT